MAGKQVTMALAGCLVLLSSACSQAGSDTSAASPDASAAPVTTIVAGQTVPTAAPNPDAPAALQVTAPLVGGGTIDFTQFAGQTLALWFWAPT